MFRYVHTNIIARDAARLIAFYKDTLGCKSIGQPRDLRGPWLDKLTGLPQAHITGEHLLLPGYDADHPTLEIFSYDSLRDTLPPEVNRPGLAHLAFEVDDVEKTLAVILAAGGGQARQLRGDPAHDLGRDRPCERGPAALGLRGGRCARPCATPSFPASLARPARANRSPLRSPGGPVLG